MLLPTPPGPPFIKAERIDLWLLAREGKTASPTERRREGALIEVGNNRGVTASAIFFLAPTVARRDLVGVVVSVDGEFTTYKIPPVVGKPPTKP